MKIQCDNIRGEDKNLCFFGIVIICFPIVITILSIFGNEDLTIIYTIADFIALIFLIKSIKNTKHDITVDINFGEDRVEWNDGKRYYVLAYKDIKVVKKIQVVYVNRCFYKEGNYKIKVVAKKHSYRFNTTLDEIRAETRFAETQVSKIYYELKKHGIKCR